MLNAFDSDRRATAYPADSDEPHGRYAGVLARDDQQMPVAVTFDAKPNGLVAWLDAAALGVVGVPFDAVAYEPPRLVLTMAAGCGGEIVWTGDFADDAIRGTWRGGGIAARFELARCPAEPAWFTTQDVAFQNAGNRLAGSLIRPLGIGPHPAAVHLPGVGPAARHRSRFLAQVLARHGVASLVYDRRGTGMSDGDGVTADFGDLAADAVAGHRLLRETDGIDPARIGIVAAGEGGWVAPLAGGMTDVAYLVLCSAPAISPAEQERREVEMRLTGAVGEAERARALALVRAKQAAVRGAYGLDQAASPASRRGRRAVVLGRRIAGPGGIRSAGAGRRPLSARPRRRPRGGAGGTGYPDPCALRRGGQTAPRAALRRTPHRPAAPRS